LDSHGTITNCTIKGSQIVGILVSPEWWWLESGSSSDLVISGNSIIDCPTPGIVVNARGGNGQIAPVGAHRNISIVDNTFSNVALPYLLCTSTEGLTVKGNRFPTEQGVQATWGSDLVPPDKKGTPVVTVNCTAGDSPARHTPPWQADWQKRRLPSDCDATIATPIQPSRPGTMVGTWP
jgi:hypothetical protein